MVNPSHIVAFTLALALAGAFVAVGGLASLQAATPPEVDSQFKPYRFAWFVGVLELVTITYGFVALKVHFRSLSASVLALFAVVTGLIIPLINEVIYRTGELPGSNGDPLKGNVTVAGLIITTTLNFFVIFAIAYHSFAASRGHSPTGSLDSLAGKV